MKCKFCEKEFQDDFTFCPYCGKRADGKVQCPHCGELISEEFRFCPVCGAEVSKKEKDNTESVDMSTEWTERRDRKSRKSGSNVAEVSRKVFKAMNNDTVKRVMFAMVAAIFFVCSFLSVVTFDMSENFVDEMQSEGSAIVDGKIKIEYNAVDLIDYAFFSMTTDYDSADKYIDKFGDDKNLATKLASIMKDDECVKVNLITQSIRITKEGCKQISDLISDIDILKLGYSAVIYASGDGTEVEGLSASLKTVGMLALINIVYSFALLVIAIVNAFTGKIKCDTVLVALMLALSLGFWAVMSGITVNVGYGSCVSGMGGALAAIISFAVIFIAYRIVVRGFSGKRENVKYLVSNAVSVLAGIVILCCVSVPALSVSLKYTSTSEDVKDTVFEYSFNQFETFDQYYYDLGKGQYYDEDELYENFRNNAQYYAEEGSTNEGSRVLKQQIGMNMLINTTFFSETNKVARSLMKVQPVFSVIEVYFAAALVAFGLAGVCNRKNYAALKIIAFILIVLASAYGIFVPILEDKVFEVSSMPDIISVSVGAASIVQFIFAAIGIVGMIVSIAFSKMYIGEQFEEEKSGTYIQLETDAFNS